MTPQPGTLSNQPASEENVASTNDDARWQSVASREAKADGEFFYGVKTTGVYCRPSCSSRLAKRENVVFFDTVIDAEKAGLRACKRCKPDGPALQQRHAAKVAEACRFIEASTELPSLETLAQRAGVSAFHFHRIFKGVTGMTPNDYANAHRAERLREILPSAGSVTDAIYDAGFNSNGRFYGTADQTLGMSPSAFRNGGVEEEIDYAIAECFLGLILVGKTERGICAILIGDDEETLARELYSWFPRATVTKAPRGFEELLAAVVRTVETPSLTADLPLDIRGTAFQRRVWEALRKIPAGETRTYTDIANEIGAPKAVRAVARACVTNEIALVIPCHRVVGKGGSSGYRWGPERKRALLEHEALTQKDAPVKDSAG